MIKKKNISQEDINTWNSFIKNPSGITDKDKAKEDLTTMITKNTTPANMGIIEAICDFPTKLKDLLT